MITVAILGAGIGSAHLEGYLALPERYKVKYICDLDAARAQSIIDDKDGENSSILVNSDIKAVLADDEIDLVDVCLPPHLHHPVSMDALNAGKHVVCEKPLVPSLAEADELIEAAKSAGRVLSPVFQYRFGKSMSQLQALQDAGLTGKAYSASMETHWNRDKAYYDVSWRGTWVGENGGAVLGHAIHNHDLLTTILGPIARLSAMTATRVNDIEVEDCAAISFEMESGALVTSSITLGAANDTSRIRVVFEGITAESGTAPYAPATDDWTFTARDPEQQARVDEIVSSISDVRDGFAGFFDELANQIAGEEHRAVTIEDGRRSIELVAAIYQSSRTKKTIELPLGDNAQLYNGWAPAQA